MDKKPLAVDAALAAPATRRPPTFQENTMPLSLFPAVALAISAFAPPLAAAAEQCPPLLQHSFTTLQGQTTQSLCQWRGKVLLVVNTASYCGLTAQYDGLEKLYARLRDKGLVVVGFPSNDFGDQEPGNNQEIAEFCRLTYGVQFPMFAKATVVGANDQGGRSTGAMELPQVPDRSRRPAGAQLRQPRQAGRPHVARQD